MPLLFVSGMNAHLYSLRGRPLRKGAVSGWQLKASHIQDRHAPYAVSYLRSGASVMRCSQPLLINT